MAYSVSPALTVYELVATTLFGVELVLPLLLSLVVVVLPGVSYFVKSYCWIKLIRLEA